MIKELNLIDEKFNRAQQKEKFLYLKNTFLKNGYVVYENLLSEEEDLLVNYLESFLLTELYLDTTFRTNLESIHDNIHNSAVTTQITQSVIFRPPLAIFRY